MVRSRRVISNTDLHASPTPKAHSSSRIYKFCKWFKWRSVYTVTIRNIFGMHLGELNQKELNILYTELKIWLLKLVAS